MARRRWVQIGGELVEAGADYAPGLRPDSGALWGDRSYDGLRATDGTPIDTRTKHREYMKANGLTTIDDFTGTWKRDAAAREQRMRGVDASRKGAIAEAVHRLNSGYKPRT